MESNFAGGVSDIDEILEKKAVKMELLQERWLEIVKRFKDLRLKVKISPPILSRAGDILLKLISKGFIAQVSLTDLIELSKASGKLGEQSEQDRRYLSFLGEILNRDLPIILHASNLDLSFKEVLNLIKSRYPLAVGLSLPNLREEREQLIQICRELDLIPIFSINLPDEALEVLRYKPDIVELNLRTLGTSDVLDLLSYYKDIMFILRGGLDDRFLSNFKEFKNLIAYDVTELILYKPQSLEL